MANTSSTFLRKSLLAVSALALTGLAVPAAFAAPAKGAPKYVKTAQNSSAWAGRGDRAQTRNTRSGNRGSGSRSENRGSRSNDRSDRSRSDRNRSDRNRSDRHRSDRNRTRTVVRVNNNRSYNPRHVVHRPITRTHSRPVIRNNYRAPYRSSLGISFNFGSGHSPFRWAASPYSFYSASYGGYGYYQNRTTCRRVTLEAWRHGHPQLVSVKQCSNPWNGTYIIQGSERLIASRW